MPSPSIFRFAIIAFSFFALLGCEDASSLSRIYNESESANATRFLAANGLQAKQKKVGRDSYRLIVSSQERKYAETLLALANLPREGRTDISEVFGDPGLVETPMEERARLSHGLSEDLSETLSSINGVINARVHILLPERDPVTRKMPPTSASVAIQYFPDADTPAFAPEIKQVVAGAAPNLSYEDVSVAFFPIASTPSVINQQPSVNLAQTTYPIVLFFIMIFAISIFIIKKSYLKKDTKLSGLRD